MDTHPNLFHVNFADFGQRVIKISCSGYRGFLGGMVRSLPGHCSRLRAFER